MTILIVEDRPAVRRMIRRVIDDLVEVVHECADGSEALAAFARVRPDMVLMDIEMGGMDGISATREIKAAYPDARIVMVTQYSDEPLRAAAFEAGACGYVLKENLLELRRVLRVAGS